jgi:hypothetical protein
MIRRWLTTWKLNDDKELDTMRMECKDWLARDLKRYEALFKSWLYGRDGVYHAGVIQ